MSLKVFYTMCLIGCSFCINLINGSEQKIHLSDKIKKINKRISIDKFSWIFVMLILVSYIDGSGDAIATEKLWNSKNIDYFLISSIVRIFTSLLTFPPIQNKIINNTNNISNIVIRLMILRFILLMSMKWVSFKQIVFFSQCSIDIFVGTIFMNDYLNKNKKLFWNSNTTSKYYISSSFAYFINENVPSLIKIFMVYNLTKLGKRIEIGLYFTLPIMIFAIGSIKLIPIIQNKIKLI